MFITRERYIYKYKYIFEQLYNKQINNGILILYS